MKVLAPLAAFIAGALLFFSVTTLAADDPRPIKDAAAALDSAKAGEETHGDYVFTKDGNAVGFDEAATEYAVYKPARTELEDLFGTPPDLAKSLPAIQKGFAKAGYVVKHVICQVYVDAPKVDTDEGKGVLMADDYGRASVQLVRCRFIKTSIEAAFHRLTGYATGDYKQTVRRVRAEREEAAKTKGES